MAPRSQRLDPILRIKQRQQDEVAQQVAAREAAHAEQQQRLEALQRYAAEYAAPVTGATLNPALLANRVAFQSKLQQAVQQQVQVVDRSKQATDVERARLMLASRETHVLEKLAASYRSEEARVADRRTQKELDDLAGRRRAAPLGAESEAS